MHLFNQTKLFLLLLISAININGSAPRLKTECCFGGTWEWPIIWQFQPLKQPRDRELDKKRDAISPFTPDKVLKIFPSTTLVEVAGIGERPGVCYHDAMRRTLGLSNEQFQQLEQSVNGCQDWITIIGMPYNFFDQTNKQKTGCLATYTSKNNIFHIHHFGEVIGKNRIRSKLALSDYTYDHDLWHLPRRWGNRINLWKLKKIYRSREGKTLLYNTLKKIIESSPIMIDLLNDKRDELLASNCYETSHRLLKRTMGLPINVRNNSGKTPLMLAAEKNNLNLVKLYVNHHANLDLQDASGTTAFMLAVDRGHNEIAEFLLERGADPFI